MPENPTDGKQASRNPLSTITCTAGTKTNGSTGKAHPDQDQWITGRTERMAVQSGQECTLDQACSKGAVRAALARKGRVKTRRVRAAAPQRRQHVVVTPERPGLSQWHSELTGCNVCAERRVYQQPGADGRVQPKQAGGWVLEQNGTAMCTDEGEEMSGSAVERA